MTRTSGTGRLAGWLGGLLVSTLLACAPPQPTMVLHVAAADRGPIDDFVVSLSGVPLSVETSANPSGDLADAGSAVPVALIVDRGAMPGCEGCYLVDGMGAGYVVRGSDALGVQYGLAHLLEGFGLRFFHPAESFIPDAPFASPPARQGFGQWMKPETRRRGLHLHTLHPIESYFAFWEPGDDNLKRAQAIIDWEIKNRGNYVQWVALDNILAKGADTGAWRAHTRSIIDYAHRRGVAVGIGLQLFGFSNLQHSFDLIDDMNVPAAQQVRERLQVLLSDLPFDNVSLSFGEFFNTDPQNFVDSTNLAYDTLRGLFPATEMSGTVHVGDSPSQKVDYMGQHMIYYFLLKYANPAIVPWIHSVMYYDLFEDAGGAYYHQDFSAHREYLLSYLRAGKRAGYHPETAYWVAFDISVPTYLPLYIRSRWLDLSQLRASLPGVPGLTEQVIFSSGWEWGYWQNDYATLRMSYTLPADSSDAVRDMLAPLGDLGQELGQKIQQLSELQHQALIGQRLAPYLAGRDVSIDIGRVAGIISQPDRPTFAEILAQAPAGRMQFASAVLAPLHSHADALDALATALSGRAGQSPWADEIIDGVTVTAARARFIHGLYQAAAAAADHQPTDGWLAGADAALERARTVVARRHAHLHAPQPDGLLTDTPNSTLYQWGYLKQAHELCYWQRERIDIDNALTGAKAALPDCLF